jgi:threonine/homoserine/homoserine lactone efflux protein
MITDYFIASQIIAMSIFSLTMSITPGPVNMINLSSGVTYGYKRTIPFVSGATVGFILLLIVLSMGFMQVIDAYPIFLKYMSLGGAGFILYISYKISISEPDISAQRVNCPTFMEGFLLQWLNPKAWLACMSGISLFVDEKSYLPLVLFISLYFVICFISLSSWAILGDKLKVLIGSKTRLKFFNYVMGILLSACAVYLLHSSLTESFGIK